jgi:hypothetical protein
MSSKIKGLNLEKALEIKIRPYGKKTCTQYRYECIDCKKELWYRKKEAIRVSGLCGKCNRKETIKHAVNGARIKLRKRPFERLYNNFVRLNHKRQKIDLTYEEFYRFCLDDICHYCHVKVNRIKYGQGSQSYLLDRKDNNLGYTKENCITCCTRCNFSKSNKFTYEEWFNMCNYLRKQNKHKY